MAVEKTAMALVSVMLFLTALQSTEAVVYTVGDSTGWTILGNYNYTAWSANKTFHVGDVIVFNYNKQFHNVMQVTHEQYNACNVSSPIMMVATGKDSITIKKTGHLYFLCGVPGHCQAGQKVDIRVPGSLAPSGAPASAISPSPTSSDTIPTPGLAPGPSTKSSAPLPYSGALALTALAVAVFAGSIAF